jgi:hypothetical protein
MIAVSDNDSLADSRVPFPAITAFPALFDASIRGRF